MEPHPTARAPLERPAAVAPAATAHVLDRLGEPLVGRMACVQRRGTEVLEGPQDVISPAPGISQQQVVRISHLPRGQAAEQATLEEELLPATPCRPALGRPARDPFVLEQALQDVER